MWLVYGTSRGIGLASVEACARDAAELILAGRSENLPESAAKLHSDWALLGLAESGSNDSVCEQRPAVDVAVNVAGTNLRQRFEESILGGAREMFKINLFGPMQLTQAIGSHVVAGWERGKIINIGSLATLIGILFISIYRATKQAVGRLTCCMADVWGWHKIQVNCIAPGFIPTDINRNVWDDPELQAWLATTQPNGRLGKPEDMGPLAVYLACIESNYVTGQFLVVDGGHDTTSLWPFGRGE
jgi:NAD(P)-dependent dehydrogenase (short-subunit alcohol dehydrogenase family)